MKQSEKLDIVLRFLYDKKFTSHYNLIEILEAHDVIVGHQEAFALAKLLSNKGLVNFIPNKDNVSVAITSNGVAYIEGDSFSHPGQSALSINISDSTNINVVQGSTDVRIHQSTSRQFNLIEQIERALQHDATLKQEDREEIVDLLETIKLELGGGKKPRWSISRLLGVSDSIASISGFVLQLSNSIQGIA